MSFSYLVWNKDKRPVTLTEIQDRMPVPMAGPYAQLCASYFGSEVSIVKYPPAVENGAVPWSKDLTGELATNPGPYTDPSLKADGGWWKRKLSQINGLTFHHTLSDSPHATAKHYVGTNGGRPTMPYTIWVTQTGEVYLCVALTEGLWHDHSGHKNTYLSVGLAGRLHEYIPAEVQLDAAAKVAAWAIKSSMLPGITKIGQVWGHMDVGTYANRTQCPGWVEINLVQRKQGADRWKKKLMSKIGALL